VRIGVRWKRLRTAYKIRSSVSDVEPVDCVITVLASKSVHHLCSTDGPTESWRKIFNLNVLALSVCTKEALQSMKERGVDDGHIVHINRFVRQMQTHQMMGNELSHDIKCCRKVVFLKKLPK
jgi:NAD(P)-dependent dehydrogenase (short-subunit alcohol dehydrogenase family)